MVLNFFERLRFDLTDTFASDVEFLSDFFEGMADTVEKPESHLQNFLFAWRKIFDDVAYIVAKKL